MDNTIANSESLLPHSNSESLLPQVVGMDSPPASDGGCAAQAKSLFGVIRRRKWLSACLLGVVALVALWPMTFLHPGEQLLLQGLSDKWVVNGPGLAIYIPVTTRAERRKAVTIDPLGYHLVTNTLTAEVRVEAGPQLLFLGAFDHASPPERKTVLTNGQYLRLLDHVTGEVRVVLGPSTVTPGPHEEAAEGPQFGASLKKNEYVKLTDKTGEVRIVRGEGLVFPRPTEQLGETQEAYKLEQDEWIKLVDEATGAVRVEKGEQIVFPSSTEVAVTDVSKAATVDDETAVLVRNKQDGLQRLVTTNSSKAPFFPTAYDEILEVRKLIRIEPHEVAIAANENNHIIYYDGRSGGGNGLAFFLPPYYRLVEMMWGSGTSAEDLKNNIVNNHKNVAFKVPVTKIDTRTQFAFFEYKVRTSDKVELTLEGTISWQVVDVPKMFSQTPDPKGDVWYHVRQRLIQAVSRVTLEQFMDTFSDLTAKVIENDTYYEKRGVLVHEVSVIRYECANPSDGEVLQQIIQETTKRMNQLTAQKSTNDVQRASMEGEFELEQQRTKLLEIKAANDKVNAVASGEADGLKLAASVTKFIEAVGVSMPNSTGQSAVELLKFFETQKTATAQTRDLATGKAQLFVTPQDLQLRMMMSGSGGWRDEL